MSCISHLPVYLWVPPKTGNVFPPNPSLAVMYNRVDLAIRAMTVGAGLVGLLMFVVFQML